MSEAREESVKGVPWTTSGYNNNTLNTMQLFPRCLRRFPKMHVRKLADSIPVNNPVVPER